MLEKCSQSLCLSGGSTVTFLISAFLGFFSTKFYYFSDKTKLNLEQLIF